MFDFVRKYSKIVAIPFFALIIVGFIFSGVDTQGLSTRSVAVARVGNSDITQQEWDAAHRVQVDRMRQRMPNVDAKLLDSPDARYATLERLVRERAVVEAINADRIAITNARLAREYREDPSLASFRKPDGSTDLESLKSVLAAQGLTPSGFDAQMRKDLVMRQVQDGVSSTAFATKGLSDQLFNAVFEQREVQIAKFEPSTFTAQVVVNDADLDAYYKANTSQFQAPEVADIEYLVLNLDAVKSGIKLAEQDINDYYAQNAGRLSGKDERRASHILIKVEKDAAADVRKKAKARAEELLAQVKAKPDTFADVARKFSQDPGSSANGGDLDFFGHGAMVKPFEDAAFSMKKGEISDVVESDFGYHIIQVTDAKIPTQKTLDELRPTLESELREKQARSKFAEVAEAFSNDVYQQADTLKPVADKLGLELKTASNVQRKPTPVMAGVLANPKFLASLFSADSIEKKQNINAVELDPNQLISARITRYSAAHTQPFTEVQADVRARLVASRAAELAKKSGMEKLAAWKVDAASEELTPAVTVSRQQAQGLPGPILDAVMRTATTTLPAWAGVDLGSKGYVVVKVTKVVPRTAPAEDVLKQERAQFAQILGSVENQLYVNTLKSRFKASITAPRPTASSPDTEQK